jgi:hypothetical protein
MGWECFCPIRDGITMATIAASISQADISDITQPYDASEANVRPFSQSLFDKNRLREDVKKNMGIANPTDQDMVAYAKNLMMSALGTNVGANDLFNMYSTCNACIMNYNGIQPDSGAVAEVGQLGARGVPCVILRGNVTGDFSGIINPMPVMATTAGYHLAPNLTNNPGSAYTDRTGALPFLKAKVDRFIKAKSSGLINEDPMTNGNYNYLMPLPPLQIFWADLGAQVFFLKHKKKSVATRGDGGTDFQKDYTKFWSENMTGTKGKTGMIQVAKAMADNLDELKNKPKYKRVFEYWL